MPVYLKPMDSLRPLARFKSVLIVPCRFCPAASMAVSTNRPYFDFLRDFLKTAPYEELIASIRSKLVHQGVEADIFRSKWLHQFVVCMWTSRRRRELSKLARNYEAVLVLGCEAALETVHDAVRSTACVVYQGMKTEGIMGIRPQFVPPCHVSLELSHITPFVHQQTRPARWLSL